MEPAGSEGRGAVRELRLHLVTWNVGTASPPPDVTSLLQLNSLGPTMDMYVIGLQEVNSRITNFLSDLAFDDPWSIFFMTVLSPLGYIKLSSVRMQGLLLLVFVKHAHLPFIRDIHTHYTRTGLYGYWGNKGGVTVRMSLYGHTICFMNCHLPAHMENTEQRLDDFEKILEMQFEGENIPSTLDHDPDPESWEEKITSRWTSILQDCSLPVLNDIKCTACVMCWRALEAKARLYQKPFRSLLNVYLPPFFLGDLCYILDWFYSY